MKISQTRVVAFWGMALVVLFAYGCPNKDGAVDPQDPQAVQAHLKAGGQVINVPARPPQPPASPPG